MAIFLQLATLWFAFGFQSLFGRCHAMQRGDCVSVRNRHVGRMPREEDRVESCNAPSADGALLSTSALFRFWPETDVVTEVGELVH